MLPVIAERVTGASVIDGIRASTRSWCASREAVCDSTGPKLGVATSNTACSAHSAALIFRSTASSQTRSVSLTPRGRQPSSSAPPSRRPRARGTRPYRAATRTRLGPIRRTAAARSLACRRIGEQRRARVAREVHHSVGVVPRSTHLGLRQGDPPGACRGNVTTASGTGDPGPDAPLIASPWARGGRGTSPRVQPARRKSKPYACRQATRAPL